MLLGVHLIMSFTTVREKKNLQIWQIFKVEWEHLSRLFWKKWRMYEFVWPPKTTFFSERFQNRNCINRAKTGILLIKASLARNHGQEPMGKLGSVFIEPSVKVRNLNVIFYRYTGKSNIQISVMCNDIFIRLFRVENTCHFKNSSDIAEVIVCWPLWQRTSPTFLRLNLYFYVTLLQWKISIYHYSVSLIPSLQP